MLAGCVCLDTWLVHDTGPNTSASQLLQAAGQSNMPLEQLDIFKLEIYWVSPKLLRLACHCVWFVQGPSEHKVHTPDEQPGDPSGRMIHKAVIRADHILPEVSPPALLLTHTQIAKAPVVTYLGKAGLFANRSAVPVTLAFQCASSKWAVWSGSENIAQEGQAFANLWYLTDICKSSSWAQQCQQVPQIVEANFNLREPKLRNPTPPEKIATWEGYPRPKHTMSPQPKDLTLDLMASQTLPFPGEPTQGLRETTTKHLWVTNFTQSATLNPGLCWHDWLSDIAACWPWDNACSRTPAPLWVLPLVTGTLTKLTPTFFGLKCSDYIVLLKQSCPPTLPLFLASTAPYRSTLPLYTPKNYGRLSLATNHTTRRLPQIPPFSLALENSSPNTRPPQALFVSLTSENIFPFMCPLLTPKSCLRW